MIVFIHNERTAGASVNRSFRDRLPHYVMTDDHSDLAGQLAPLVALHGRRLYVGGHFGFMDFKRSGFHAPDDIVISAVRDPVLRLHSLYKLAHRSPEWLPHITGALEDYHRFSVFADFCLERRYYTGNLQCARIGGAPTFRAAVDAIEAEYALVGSADHTEAFIAAIAAVVEPVLPDWRYNGAHNEASGAGLDPIDRETAARIRADNLEDSALAAWVARDCGGLFRRASFPAR